MSTLHVENLKGLSSGGNANKIIVPSGQTLDASNGFTPPADYIIQIVSGERTSITATGGTSYVDTGLTATITPTSTSSKILVSVNQYFTFRTATFYERHADFQLLRDTTQIAFQRINQLTASTASVSYFGKMSSYQKLDTPATTSAITYKTQMKLNSGSADIFVAHDNAINTITLMEIAG